MKSGSEAIIEFANFVSYAGTIVGLLGLLGTVVWYAVWVNNGAGLIDKAFVKRGPYELHLVRVRTTVTCVILLLGWTVVVLLTNWL